MRSGLWALVLWMVFAQVATPVTTPEATPVVAAEQPYLSHAARFVSSIPGDWVPDRSLAHEYVGDSGFISSRPMSSSLGFGGGPASLADACEAVLMSATRIIAPVTVDGMPGCTVLPQATGADMPAFAVITRPDPLTDPEFVMIATNRGSLDGILETASFDLSAVSADLYLDAVLDIISVRSLQRDLLDWEAIRRDAQVAVANLSPDQGFAAAHTMLQEVMEEIWAVGGDGHNTFMPIEMAAGFAESMSGRQGESLPIVAPQSSAPARVTVTMPGFSGSEEAGMRFVEVLWDGLDAFVTESTCGIVIDLRQNTGGNMYPMLQGLGPVIGAGPVLGFTDAAGKKASIAMDAAYQLLVEGVPTTSYTPARPAPNLGARSLAVAVLIGPMTISSGEATAIGLMETDYPVRFFGEPSGGYATSGYWLSLIDGSMIGLSDYWTTTVDGTTFPDGVPPDVVIDGWNMPTVVDEWIRETAGC